MSKALAVFLLLALPGFSQTRSDAPPRARSYRSPVPVAGAHAFPAGKVVAIPTPLGLPPVPIPADNPPTAETIALGRRLFFDKQFSRDGTVSCGTCHDPKFGMSDPRQFSLGVGNVAGTRNAPAIFNAAYNATQFWDGRASTLEQQAEGPVQNPIEMQHSLVGVERRLSGDPTYVVQFAVAWGAGPISYEMVEKSLASYERTLITGNSPFDRYYYGGDKNAMSAAAIRGMKLFLNPGLNGPTCVGCHRVNSQFATFDDVRFHNTGVAWDPVAQEMKDIGRQAIAPNEKGIQTVGAFKPPTLRNIALTAPYQHDGSQKTLEEVLDFYFQGGRGRAVGNQSISQDMPRLPFDPSIVAPGQEAQAKADIVEFLKALTSAPPPGSTPP